MFNLAKSEEEPRRLEEALDHIVSDLGNYPSHSEEYSTIAANVKVLAEANAADQATYKKPTVSPETMATIGANLAGILLILNYERLHVLTSKALVHIVKLKI